MKIIMDKKKKLLVLLAVMIPATSLIAWLTIRSLRGDKSDNPTTENAPAFNTQMPKATLPESKDTKLEVYKMAQKDLAKQQEQETNAQRIFDPGPPETDIFAGDYLPGPSTPTGKDRPSVADNEQKVRERLDRLQAALQASTPGTPVADSFDWQHGRISSSDPEVARLEKLLVSLQTPDSSGDPEMQQLENLLDKLLDIQYPERVKERMKTAAPSTVHQQFSVSTEPYQHKPESTSHQTNGFWGIEQALPEKPDTNQVTILATVHSDQQVQDNSTIKLRLLQDIYINNQLIPKGNFISGVCKLTNDRVLIDIHELIYQNTIYPASLTLYDMDGMEGIRVLGGTGADVAQNELNRSIESLQLYNPDPSIASQTAAGGIQTLRSLLTRKNKKIRAEIKAGHQVLLKTTASY